MNRYILSLLLLSVPLTAQTTHGPTTPRRVTAAAGKTPAILGAEYFSILPHITDGGGWTSSIYVVNTGTDVETYEIDLYGDTGQALNFTFGGNTGSTSVLTGTLSPGQTVIYNKTGQGTGGNLLDGWGSLNANSGQAISTYMISSIIHPQYYVAAQGACVANFGIGGTTQQPGAVISFDNTAGNTIGLAFTNPDVTNQYPSGDTLDIIVYDQNYNQIGSHQVTVAPGNKTLIVTTSSWPETVNASGSFYLYPDSSDFSPITPLVSRIQYAQNAQTFTCIPVLQFY
jgi:hypothetical protein